MKRLALALALLAFTPAFAAAQQPLAPRIVLQFTSAGDPEIRVGSDHTLEALRRCPPGGDPCDAVASNLGREPYLLGETPAGTVIEADVKSPSGVVTTLRSVPWQGRVAAAVAPSVTGEAKVGGTVTAVAGTWAGGWGDRPGWRTGEVIREVTGTGLIACRTAAREDCWRPLTGPLSQRWAGWYLFAVSSHRDGDDFGRPVAVVPAAIQYWPFPTRVPSSVPATPTMAYSAPVQVCCTLPAPAADPVPAPTSTLRKRAVRAQGRLLLGRVDCTLRCTVGLTVSGGGRTLTRTVTVEGPAALSIPPRRGNLSVRVKVDGQLLVRGRVRAR